MSESYLWPILTQLAALVRFIPGLVVIGASLYLYNRQKSTPALLMVMGAAIGFILSVVYQVLTYMMPTWRAISVSPVYSGLGLVSLVGSGSFAIGLWIQVRQWPPNKKTNRSSSYRRGQLARRGSMARLSGRPEIIQGGTLNRALSENPFENLNSSNKYDGSLLVCQNSARWPNFEPGFFAMAQRTAIFPVTIISGEQRPHSASG